jgi:type VI secretion system secreted protein VgrG
VGTLKTGASTIDDKAAPLAALYKSSATQVSYQNLDSAQSDAPEKSTAPQADKLPHSADPTLSLVGRGGIAVVAGQSLQFANAETSNFMSGQDTQAVTGGQLRMHAGQAIGILGGAVSPGEDNRGLTLIAAQDPVRYESQSSTIAIQAKDLVNIQSANAHIDWAAAKSISLSTADGANITISGGNITVQCPGKLTVHSSLRRFEDAGRMSYPLPIMPRNVCLECLAKRAAQRSAFINKGA